MDGEKSYGDDNNDEDSDAMIRIVKGVNIDSQ